jgi:hypothetical protein
MWVQDIFTGWRLVKNQNRMAETANEKVQRYFRSSVWVFRRHVEMNEWNFEATVRTVFLYVCTLYTSDM